MRTHYGWTQTRLQVIDVRYRGTANQPIVASRDDVERHIAQSCFTTGPPRLIGVELEHTVHDVRAPAAPVSLERLRDALGTHAPPTINPDGRHVRLPGGGVVTLEPGGQVEISSAPQPRLTALYDAVSADLAHLAGLLAARGLRLGHHGMDARPTPRLLDTPRYRAMARGFARAEPSGLSMMTSTAGLQICLDCGQHDLTERWEALHAIGPALTALFCTCVVPGGGCARLRTWLDMAPRRTHPVGEGDPVAAWTRYVLAAPVLCVRREHADWWTPHGMSFADWITRRDPWPPRHGDLELHMSTLFPPVRPRGYFEVRYLDTQPSGEWIAPVVLVHTLLQDKAMVDAVRRVCGPASGLWRCTAQRGMRDQRLAATAIALIELAGDRLDPALGSQVLDIVDRRLSRAATPALEDR